MHSAGLAVHIRTVPIVEYVGVHAMSYGLAIRQEPDCRTCIVALDLAYDVG